MWFKVLTVTGLFFLFIHCEKESPIVPVEKMDTFYPEYDFQPLVIPSGLESSTDSMAQVVHGYLKLANSIEDYIKWIYILPSEVLAHDEFSVSQKNMPECNMWIVNYRIDGQFEIYEGNTFINLKILEEQSWYYWNSIITFYRIGKVDGPFVENVNYIDCGAKKDFSTGYMRKSGLFNAFKFHCSWEWEISDDFEDFKMTVVLNDMSEEYSDWPEPETRPGKADIIQHKSGSGEIKYYTIDNYHFYPHFFSNWDSLGNGQYQIYNQDGSQIIRQGVW